MLLRRCALYLFAALSAFGLTASQSFGADLEAGDFAVGVSVPLAFGESQGRIVRVRAGVATPFCTAQSTDPNEPDYYFNTPSDVIFDAQGRVVFLAPLSSNFGSAAYGWGLWRCDSLGAAPTLLGAFGSDHPYPSPLGARDVQRAAGLHLKITKGIDLNNLTMANAQYYVFAVSDDCCNVAPHDTIAYDPAADHWITSFEEPVPTAGPLFDMINAGGYTFSVGAGGLRGLLEPLTLDFQIGEFSGGIALQKLTDLIDAAVDDVTVPDAPSTCPPHADGVPLSVPRNAGGGINVMDGFFQLAWHEDQLVLETNSIGPGHAYLPEIGLALFNFDPQDDNAGRYHDDLTCAHLDKLSHNPWHAFNQFNDPTGEPFTVSRVTPDGTAGTQSALGRIVGVGPSTHVQILAAGLNNPVGIDVYPGFLPTTDGVAFFVQIDSPVDVLITGPDGRRIGKDLAAGTPINDYADGGFDSATNEPRIYAIRDPALGAFTIETRGTGIGPYHITLSGVNLATDVFTQASFSGNAALGSGSLHGASVLAGGGVIEDADGDGVDDASDNCPNEPNPVQEDAGGVGAATGPDGIGDACQCGDVSGDGRVTSADSVLITRSLLVPPTAALAKPLLCNVGGNASCSSADAVIVTRALLIPPTAQIGAVCAPALP
jgi:hypothetical protein